MSGWGTPFHGLARWSSTFKAGKGGIAPSFGVTRWSPPIEGGDEVEFVVTFDFSVRPLGARLL